MSKIIEKQYYAFKVKLASPLNVSNGNSENTDSDVLKNRNGEFFVPGTSIAGAYRDALKLDKDKECMMGYTNGENGRMSSMLISDLYFEGTPNISTRDGIKLTEEKTVAKGSKFDMEIIETGAVGTMYIQCVVREGLYQAEEYIKTIKKLVSKITNGDIRFGANKNRGFGRIEILGNIYFKSFSQDNHDGYLDFMQDYKNIEKYDSYSVSEWLKDYQDTSDFIKISVPLKVTGGISIRKYSAKPNQADYEHITCNGKPVIPGSSWNGAIRADIRKTLKQLGVENPDIIISNWFGCIKDKKNENSQQSVIVIGESIIENAVKLPMTRNKINRFDASTCSGALYSEVAYCGGTTTLEIMIRKDESKNYKALIDIIKIVISDIENGYVAVGGQVAVGKGIFASNGDTQYSEKVSDGYDQLYAVI